MRRPSLAVLLAFSLFSTAAFAEPSAADRATARTLAQEGQQALETKSYGVTISVLGPTNPEVIIDSTPIPTASLGVKRPVNPGSHTIRVSAEGYVPSEKSIKL